MPIDALARVFQRVFPKIAWWSRHDAAPQPARNGKRLLGIGPEIQADADDPLDGVPRYPPYDTGIPVVPVERIIASQKDLIERIYRTAGISREEFAERIEPVITRLARYVHLLPATSTAYHRGAGGLLRLALEVGLHALQTANASVFPTGGGVERRFFMQPKWALATFLAGVCSQLYRTINNMAVLTRTNEQWAPLLMPLYDWALSVNGDVYFIRWFEEKDVAGAQASSAYIVNMVVPPAVMQYLAGDNTEIIPAMTSAITGASIGTSDNVIARIIAPVTTRVIEEDLKRSPMNYGHMSVGVHLEPHLIDAMRCLVKDGSWTWNNSKSAVVWIGSDGVYIDWPQGAAQVVNRLTRDSFAGVPRDGDTLAEMLCNAGVFARTPSASKYWSITLPGTAEVLEGAVKFRQSDLIFPPGFDFGRYEQTVLSLTPTAANVATSATKAEGERKKPLSTAEKATKTDFLEAAPAQGGEISSSVGDGATGSLAPDATKDGGSGPCKHKESPGQKIPRAEAPAGPKTAPDEQRATMAEKLLGALKKENAWLLREILDHYRNNKLTGVVANLPQGLGISHDELSAHGQPAMEFLDELTAKQWLWVDRTKPTRKIHSLEVRGQTCKMVVLKPDIACGLGFAWEAP